MKDDGSPQSIRRSLRSDKTWSYSHYMYRPAARSSCSFKTSWVVRWLLHSIVPFHSLKCMGSSGEKMHLFQFLSTVHAKVATVFSTLQTIVCISEIGNQYSIYWAYKKFIFPKFKNWAGMPTISFLAYSWWGCFTTPQTKTCTMSASKIIIQYVM